jgi:lipoyl(octanoyl) transferase
MTLENQLVSMPAHKESSVEWRVSDGLVPYADAVAFMESRVEAIAAGEALELIWFLEHPPLYTAGTSARTTDLLNPRFPVHLSGRGGQITYHGPGQRVAYVMLDLNRRGPDLRAFVCSLENWIIAALALFNIKGERREGRIGVWVPRPEKPRGANGEIAEDKIAAIGIRVRRWVTFHGIALNVAPDLSRFSGIVPCGISAQHFGVTSLRDFGVQAAMSDVDQALRQTFEPIFGRMARGCRATTLGAKLTHQE